MLQALFAKYGYNEKFAEYLNIPDNEGKAVALMQGRAVVPRAAGGERHFRCETCGTISHGAAAPATCPTCGKTTFFEADLQTSTVDAVEAESDSWGVQLAETLRYALMLLAEAGRPLTGMEALFHDRVYAVVASKPR